MKYCRNCGQIFAESYDDYDRESCINCGFPLIEDPDMTEEQFLQLSESQKDAYELHIIDLCKQSGYFNEQDCERGKHYDYYFAFRFDKYEQLSGKKAWIKKNLTPDEEAIEEWKIRQHIFDVMTGADTANSGSSNAPQCPTCHSTNISRISTTARVTNAALFGLFGQKRKHQFRCNNCHYEW